MKDLQQVEGEVESTLLVAIKERDALIKERDVAVEERDVVLKERDVVMEERDVARTTIAKMEHELSESMENLQHSEAQVAAMAAQVSENDDSVLVKCRHEHAELQQVRHLESRKSK